MAEYKMRRREEDEEGGEYKMAWGSGHWGITGHGAPGITLH